MNNINLQIDAAARQVSQNGKAVYLTQTEFDLLLYLLDNAGRITTRSELLAQVWGITAPIHTRTVDMHIAKLRHSIVGHYDFIVAGLYRLEQNGRDDYEFQISSPIVAEKLEPFFDELAVEYGYDSRDIKLIEGLLFLTMIPLHGDDTNRQRAFYLTAVRKLNEVLYGEQAI